MKFEVNEETLDSIRNPVLRTYAQQYMLIYQDFLKQVRKSGLDLDSGDEDKQLRWQCDSLT